MTAIDFPSADSFFEAVYKTCIKATDSFLDHPTIKNAYLMEAYSALMEGVCEADNARQAITEEGDGFHFLSTADLKKVEAAAGQARILLYGPEQSGPGNHSAQA